MLGVRGVFKFRAVRLDRIVPVTAALYFPFPSRRLSCHPPTHLARCLSSPSVTSPPNVVAKFATILTTLLFRSKSFFHASFFYLIFPVSLLFCELSPLLLLLVFLLSTPPPFTLHPPTH